MLQYQLWAYDDRRYPAVQIPNVLECPRSVNNHSLIALNLASLSNLTSEEFLDSQKVRADVHDLVALMRPKHVLLNDLVNTLEIPHLVHFISENSVRKTLKKIDSLQHLFPIPSQVLYKTPITLFSFMRGDVSLLQLNHIVHNARLPWSLILNLRGNRETCFARCLVIHAGEIRQVQKNHHWRLLWKNTKANLA